MVDVPMALGSLKIALDIAKGMKDLNDASVRNIESIKLMEQIIAAQMAQASLIQQVRDLETEVAQFKNWDAEKDRYTLTDYGGGTFAYALKPDKANGQPPHRICPNCYEDKKVAPLQSRGKTHFSQEHCICTRCKTNFHFGVAHTPALQSRYNRSRDDPFS